MQPPRAALGGFTVKLNAIATPMRQSRPNHQGNEMSRHAEFLANPACGYASRPAQSLAAQHLREHLRQYLPKDRFVSLQAVRCYRRQLEHQAARYDNWARATGSVLANAGRPSQVIACGSLNLVLHFTPKTAMRFKSMPHRFNMKTVSSLEQTSALTDSPIGVG